jgi:hypothetical protein
MTRTRPLTAVEWQNDGSRLYRCARIAYQQGDVQLARSMQRRAAASAWLARVLLGIEWQR